MARVLERAERSARAADRSARRACEVVEALVRPGAISVQAALRARERHPHRDLTNGEVIVRFRIDGVLHDIADPALTPADLRGVINVVKTRCAEHRPSRRARACAAARSTARSSTSACRRSPRTTAGTS